jgi:hypothetical protein
VRSTPKGTTVEQVGERFVVTIPYLRTGELRLEVDDFADLYGLARHLFYAADDVSETVMQIFAGLAEEAR